MMKRNALIAIISFTVVSTAIADGNLGTCAYPEGLKNGINLSAYEQCISQFVSCPKNGPFLDGKCVQEKVDANSSCKELSELAKQVNASADLITLKNLNGFTSVEVSFPGDGGQQYYILSPSGCLIDTVIDPRDLSPELKQKYANSDFFLETHSPLNHVVFPNKTNRFTIELQVKKQCRACEVIGLANIAFDFAQDGMWLNTQLFSFTEKKADHKTSATPAKSSSK